MFRPKRAARETRDFLVPPERDRAERLHRLVLVALQIGMGAEVVVLAWNGLWSNAAIVVGIMALTVAPLVFREQLPVRVPYAFQVMVVVFVFAALFLGEVRDYYERFWWWDSLLHLSSGLLLGQFGFMLIYILNEDARVHLSMKPGFMALFAFGFALSLGALWEVYEFGMDQLFGTQMQKPMLRDPSGLTDTMADLILDAAGAAAVSFYGYFYMRRGQPSLLARLIRRVAHDNPELFRRRPFRPGRRE